MKINFDWKFWIALTATIAGIIGPVGLWYFDIQSKSLVMQIESTTALTPSSPHIATDLKVLISGRTLSNPYSTIVKITNSGSKPILAADIEDTIDLDFESNTKLVQAQIVDKWPSSLKPSLRVVGQRISMQPLLLNQNDYITVAILTENGKPKFEPRGRIAGVSDINLIENSSEQKIPFKSYLPLPFVPILYMGVYMALLMKLLPDTTYSFGALITAACSTVIVCTSVVTPIWVRFFSNSFFSLIICVFIITTPGIFAAWFLAKKRTPEVKKNLENNEN